MSRTLLTGLAYTGVFIAALALGAAGGGLIDGAPVAIIDASVAWLAILALLAGGTALILRGGGAAAALMVSGAAVALIVLARQAEGIVFAGGSLAGPALLSVAAASICLGLARAGRSAGAVTVVIVPGLFAVLILFLWQAATIGFAVPPILLPSPSAIASALSKHAYDLGQDFIQTVVREAVPGFLIGSVAGIAVALAANRSRFLRDGLLPIGNWLGVMPIVGVAPIMVMWFGFGWESKVAVVVLMTFFPTLVTTLAGLSASSPIERDLMASYSASYRQTLIKLQLPAAAPFIIAALKLNASLALIGAIVAEFFGTPTYGLGFRISTEVGRLNLDRVWAAIAVAAVTGTAAYGVLGLAERRLTFWSPSRRQAASP